MEESKLGLGIFFLYNGGGVTKSLLSELIKFLSFTGKNKRNYMVLTGTIFWHFSAKKKILLLYLSYIEIPIS